MYPRPWGVTFMAVFGVNSVPSQHSRFCVQQAINVGQSIQRSCALVPTVVGAVSVPDPCRWVHTFYSFPSRNEGPLWDFH